jgi:hypothetical protein
MDWQFEVLVLCNGVPESCIVVPYHLQRYFRILQQNIMAFIYLFSQNGCQVSSPHIGQVLVLLSLLGVGACSKKHQNGEHLLEIG